MRLIFKEQAFQDLQYWIKHDNKKAKKIFDLIENIDRTPFEGLGKPEPLKHFLAHCWSRRIDAEHRLIYKVIDESIEIISCRYHYK